MKALFVIGVPYMGVYRLTGHDLKGMIRGAFCRSEAFEFGVPLCLLIFLAAANMDPGKALKLGAKQHGWLP